MDKTPIHIDEYGVLRFSVFHDNGTAYEFEQEPDSDYLFITQIDKKGKTTAKRLVDTTELHNKEIVEIYNDYLKEQDDRKSDSDDKRFPS